VGGLGSNSSSGLLDTGSSRIPKNSSSPNLLSDLILDDLMGLGGGTAGGTGGAGLGKLNLGQSSTASMNKSNPAINNESTFNNSQSSSIPPLNQANQRPNYNRNQIFDPPPASASAPQGMQVLNDVFADILNSQGFATTGKDHAGKTINDMRKIEMLSNPNLNPTQMKVLLFTVECTMLSDMDFETIFVTFGFSNVL
jgi:hypothetical protein